MRRTGIAVSTVLVTVSFCWSDSRSGCADACRSTASANSGVLFACPQGDGDQLVAKGLTVTIAVRDDIGTPVVNIPASDIWLTGCANLLALCGGHTAISASAPTDVNGETTITADLAAGGCDLGGVRAVAQGVIIGGICEEACIPVKVKSPDLDGNLVVNLVDFANFGAGFASPPKVYNECIDFTLPFGTVTLSDFAKFGSHANHRC